MHDFSELEVLEPEDKLKQKHLGTLGSPTGMLTLNNHLHQNLIT